MITANDLQKQSWFQELVQEVGAAMAKLQTTAPDRRQAQIFERDELESKSQGWIESLSKPHLDRRLREAIESQFQQATDRIDEINRELEQVGELSARFQGALDPTNIIEQLNRLDEVLGSNNPSAGNMMLSQHIEGIYCNRDGEVIVRACRLGALAGVRDLLPHDGSRPSQLPDVERENASHVVTPRKRGRLDVAGVIADDDEAMAAIEFATNPKRFAGLGKEWFTEDVFQIPIRLSWAEENARAVAEYRLHNSATMEVTAVHFETTVNTIRAALHHAKDNLGIDAFGKELSLRTRPNWPKDNATAVAEYLSQHSMKAAVVHFQKSDTTIRKAHVLALSQFVSDQPRDKHEGPES